MRIATIRSGQIESTHDISVVATDARGQEIGSWGEPEITFFYRSVIKPFQGTVTLEAGADLSPEQLAMACASHGGYPIHRSIAKTILADAGLDEGHLQCPPAWPRAPGARDLLFATGYRRPTRLFHNCSGKHSGWLAACAAQDWPVDTYLEPSHPLQQRVASMMRGLTGFDPDPDPVGVDGCGAPTLRGNLIGLARAFSTLSVDSRFAEARMAVHRFPALVSSNTLPDGRFAAWWGGPVKVGAEGLIAAGRNGIGIAAKSHEGSMPMAVVGIMEASRQLGLLPEVAQAALHDVARIPVYGGGQRVGVIEPISS